MRSVTSWPCLFLTAVVVTGGGAHASDRPEAPAETQYRPAQSPTELIAHEYMDEWEKASKGLPRATTSEVARMHDVHRDFLSEHEMALIREFRGSINAAVLRERYEWTTRRTSRDGATLSARPRDQLEQLFYSRFEVSFDSQTKLPVSLKWFDRNRGESTAVADLHTPRRLPRTSAVVHAGHAEESDSTLDLDVADCLAQWERASTRLRPPTSSTLRPLLTQCRRLDSRDTAAVLRFTGPVEAKKLRSAYNWTPVRQTGRRIFLRAESRSTVGVEPQTLVVSLDARTWLPQTVYVDSHTTGLDGTGNVVTAGVTKNHESRGGDSESIYLHRSLSVAGASDEPQTAERPGRSRSR